MAIQSVVEAMDVANSYKDRAFSSAIQKDYGKKKKKRKKVLSLSALLKRK